MKDLFVIAGKYGSFFNPGGWTIHLYAAKLYSSKEEADKDMSLFKKEELKHISSVIKVTEEEIEASYALVIQHS